GGTVTAVFVKVGDAVRSGQALVEVSTEKTSMEVTAEADGTVEAVHVKPGDKVPVGGTLITLKTGAAPPKSTPDAKAPEQKPLPAAKPQADAPRPAPGSGATVDVVLANPGEGIEGGTVTAVFVKVGDAVRSGQARRHRDGGVRQGGRRGAVGAGAGGGEHREDVDGGDRRGRRHGRGRPRQARR
ncbi:MAG: hypothetical protein J0I06_07455, partial [Planctomycetes bacterium]|nr:hypothetical protein [Planctomycetota bacterium]